MVGYWFLERSLEIPSKRAMNAIKSKHETMCVKSVTSQRKKHSFQSLKGVHDLKEVRRTT